MSAVLQNIADQFMSAPPLDRLNLGCNDDAKDGYWGVDQCPPADEIADLSKPWPWPSSCVVEVFAHDVAEHVPSKIHFMNESWRVLKSEGILDLWVPCVYLSDGRVNPGAFADPTHSSFWTMDDRYYFLEEWNNPQGERGRFGPAYGITALFRPLKWELIDYGLHQERRSKIRALLQAIK